MVGTFLPHMFVADVELGIRVCEIGGAIKVGKLASMADESEHFVGHRRRQG